MVTCRASSTMVRGNEIPDKQDRGRDTRLDHCQPGADRDHPARIPDRAADLGQREKSVQGGLLFRDCLVDQWEDEPVADLVVNRPAGRRRPVQVGEGLLGGGDAGAG